MKDLIIKPKIAFEPRNKMLVVKEIEKDDQRTSGGLLIPDSVDLSNVKIAKIIASCDEEQYPRNAKVYYWHGMQREFTLDGEEYRIINHEGILGIVK